MTTMIRDYYDLGLPEQGLPVSGTTRTWTTNIRDYQNREYQNRDYQNRDYQNRDYQNKDYQYQGVPVSGSTRNKHCQSSDSSLPQFRGVSTEPRARLARILPGKQGDYICSKLYLDQLDKLDPL